MNDSIEEIEQPAGTQPASSGSVGEILAAARAKAGMSVEEAASQLRLSVRQVQAIEADDASALPAPTFVRGFIRNYAKLLTLDAEVLLEIYRVYAPASAQGAITLHSENIPILNHDKKAWLPYALASAVVALALGGWMVYMEYAVDAKPAAIVPEAEKVAATEPAMAVPVPVQVEPAVPAASPAVMETSQPAAPVAPAVMTSRLSLSFIGQSWVQVTDRDGKEIFNKSQPAGSLAVVEGQSPFNVVVGNAEGVQISYNDKPVDLALHTKANVARLTLE